MGNDNRTYSAVFRTAEAGKADNLRVLINAGGNVNLPGFWYGKTPLIVAAKSGSDECVELLLEAGADVGAVDDFEKMTALMEAAASGNERSVRLLLDSNAINKINWRNRYGSTALMEAAIKGNAQSVRMLIDKGADLAVSSESCPGFCGWDIREGGQTVLMMASSPECVELLLDAGADVNAQDKDGRNALVFQFFLP
jgi:ankyrin repeat protein